MHTIYINKEQTVIAAKSELDKLINDFTAWRLKDVNSDTSEAMQVAAQYQCETESELFWAWKRLHVKN